MQRKAKTKKRRKKPKAKGPVKRAPKLTPEQLASVAEEVRRRRHEAGLTLRQVAEQAGVHTSAVGAIEQARTTPAIGTLTALARALACQVRDLVANLRTDSAKKPTP